MISRMHPLRGAIPGRLGSLEAYLGGEGGADGRADHLVWLNFNLTVAVVASGYKNPSTEIFRGFGFLASALYGLAGVPRGIILHLTSLMGRLSLREEQVDRKLCWRRARFLSRALSRLHPT